MNGMTDNDVSAQVVLVPASGHRLAADELITSQTLEMYMPDPAAAHKVRDFLKAAGFTVGALVGNSFSITAKKDVFESVFKTRLVHVEKKGVMCVSTNNEMGYELPVGALPADVGGHLVAVTFTAPPEFGPVEFN